jgi:hypothetical protein
MDIAKLQTDNQADIRDGQIKGRPSSIQERYCKWQIIKQTGKMSRQPTNN